MRLAGLALVAALLPGCQRCGSKHTAGDGGDARAGEAEAVGTPPTAPFPAFAALESPQGYGLPSGCKFEGKVQKATLPEGRTRFVAPRSELGALALAQGRSGTVASAGFLDASARAVAPAPWAELDAPPLFERAGQIWLGAWLAPTATGRRRALLWRGGSHAEPLAEGDQLELSDLACAGDDCVLLSHRVSAAAAPGASWITGKAGTPASAWRRVDLVPSGDERWLPLGIASVGPGGTGFAALASDKHVALYELGADKAEPLEVLDAPHGAYELTRARELLLIMPGDRTDRPCGAEEFPVVVQSRSRERHELRTPAPPESVIARPLSRGALIGWVAPVSCQHSERRVVYLTLLDDKGAPASSPMAVADATGFALSTRGDELGLWLLSGRELSLVRAKCEVRP